MTTDLETYGVWRGDVLCLSGGGYRAALFHLGALTRLNELGLLSKVETVGAVAGGSLLAALLAARVPWPLQGAYRDWPELLAEPMRAIARRNARARALLRRPIPGSGGAAALEERYARELAGPQPGARTGPPRFVFGGAGLALGEMTGDGCRELRWEIGSSAPYGYDAMLVEDVIATVRTDLDAFGEAEQAVLENHGYLLADAAARTRLPKRIAPIEPLPPEPPHPHWMSEIRARKALAASSRRARPLGRMWPRRVEQAKRAVEPPAEESAALLERHRPIVQYDSLESYRADSVASIVNLAMGRRCNSLHRADGTLIAAAVPPEHSDAALLDLDFFGSSTYANGLPVRDDDYLEESGGSPAADALAMRRRQNCADVVYGRACRDAEDRLWLQYWLFFYYNDKGLLSLGLHEGDWEMIQLRLGEDALPEAATYGQHSGGARAAWEEVERRAVGGREAPVIYCARGSHACLFRAGAQAAPVVPDHNDGLGPAERPRLVTIGEGGPGWAGWPGHWGSTRRREAFEGASPRGPGRQPRWHEPAEFHREARPNREIADLPGAAPAAPVLSAQCEGRTAMVSYRFPTVTGSQGRPERIVAAPYRSGETEPPRTQTFMVEGEEGVFALQLPPHGGRYEGVRLSIASELGVAGETLSARFV
ncbi:MAG: patatin-like phospholipase family protein [Solirubrobacterales bacterium]